MGQADLILQARVRMCQACPLALTRTLAVPGWVGTDYQGQVALMLEAPGACEDGSCKHSHIPAVAGAPLVGRNGQLMNRLLTSADMTREDLAILNRVRCQPPRNRLDDHPEAVLACEGWTVEELLAYDPKVVVLMGKTAIKAVFPKFTSVTDMRGKVRKTGPEHKYGSRTFVASVHPAAALRDKSWERFIVEDLRLAKELADEE